MSWLTNKNMTVPWYLMASYLYYHLDESLITDGDYDALAKLLLENYDVIEHRHKYLISKEDLRAGSCFIREDEFPEITKSTALHLLAIKQEQEKKKRKTKNGVIRSTSST